MGMAANLGIFAMASLATYVHVTPVHWRWMLLVCAAPIALGLFVLVAVPESPRWLALRATKKSDDGPPDVSAWQIFRSPLLTSTAIGILLATIPLIGTWGSANWMTPWAAEAGETASPPNLSLQAEVGRIRALSGIVGSLLGGWMAHVLGRRRSFCLISLGALFCAQWTFWMLNPLDNYFLYWVAGLGFFTGTYFGWLPLFLPELFPTHTRSMGTGVSFQFGRILAAATVFATGLLTTYFGGDYARIGRVTSLIFAIGIFVIWLAPDTSRTQLND
jgi:MFS family permease